MQVEPRVPLRAPDDFFPSQIRRVRRNAICSQNELERGRDDRDEGEGGHQSAKLELRVALVQHVVVFKENEIDNSRENVVDDVRGEDEDHQSHRELSRASGEVGQLREISVEVEEEKGDEDNRKNDDRQNRPPDVGALKVDAFYRVEVPVFSGRVDHVEGQNEKEEKNEEDAHRVGRFCFERGEAQRKDAEDDGVDEVERHFVLEKHEEGWRGLDVDGHGEEGIHVEQKHHVEKHGPVLLEFAEMLAVIFLFFGVGVGGGSGDVGVVGGVCCGSVFCCCGIWSIRTIINIISIRFDF